MTEQYTVKTVNSRHFVIDQASLRQDGIFAHAIHSEHETLEGAKAVAKGLCQTT